MLRGWSVRGTLRRFVHSRDSDQYFVINQLPLPLHLTHTTPYPPQVTNTRFLTTALPSSITGVLNAATTSAFASVGGRDGTFMVWCAVPLPAAAQGKKVYRESL